MNDSDALSTIAEQSGFRRTGRTDEVARLCAAYAAAWPGEVRVLQFGRSAEGRDMLALLVCRGNPRTLPLLMIQAGIHPGESDGKDAGFIALRELLSGRAAPAALEKIALLFVPAFNVDGHERFGRWNRPNQNGPEEMGWRTTAQNLNLNRDYTKADAPEMQALLRLNNEWDPLVYADLHVTDGADFEPDISIQVEPINQGDPNLCRIGTQLRDALIERLAREGSLPLPFYPDLARTDDPASGFQLSVYSPRFSTGYPPARNRFGVLVETHSWKDYATRVRVTRNTVVGLAELVAEHGPAWHNAVQRADQDAARLSGCQIALDYSSDWRETGRSDVAAAAPAADDGTLIDFRGYAYTRVVSPISGSLVTTYDPKTPRIWRVPYRARIKPSVVTTVPRAYLVPPAYAALIGAKLELHGIRCGRLKRAVPKTSVETFKADKATFSRAPFEGRFRVELEGAWTGQILDIAADSLIVPTAQPLARLTLALLEPQAPDSFAAWGFFNAHFEQKEYMEPYVAEPIARQMLEKDPALAKLFNEKLSTDSAFASDPAARLEFFLRRHESWDWRYNLYPIYRTGEAIEAASVEIAQ
ncbi:MAG TPA: M14 family metallopeptidase [Burkholderiaceae bacterium]